MEVDYLLLSHTLTMRVCRTLQAGLYLEAGYARRTSLLYQNGPQQQHTTEVQPS